MQYHCWILPDYREQFDLREDGKLSWERHSNGLMREQAAGSWRQVGDEVVIEVKARSHILLGNSETLAIRHYRNCTYLVLPDELKQFAAHGPMQESCLRVMNAPLVYPAVPSLWMTPRDVPRHEGDPASAIDQSPTVLR